MKPLFTMLRAALLCACGALCAHAQTTDVPSMQTPRYEVGGHLYTLGTTDSDIHDAGLGGRFTYNLTNYLALDTELNASLTVEDEFSSFNGVQGFAGLKAGWRGRRVGLFAKARPGFVTNFHRAGASLFDGARVVRPAFDVGGVFEYYVTRHAALRFDASDVIIPFGGQVIEEVRCPCPRALGTTHTLQTSIGFAIRF
jgi:hypothetical protein